MNGINGSDIRANALFAAIGCLDADLIDEARPVKADGTPVRERRKRAWVSAAAAAAVLAAVLLTAPVLRPFFTQRNAAPRAEGVVESYPLHERAEPQDEGCEEFVSGVPAECGDSSQSDLPSDAEPSADGGR